MRIVVTGATGNVGTSVVGRLIEDPEVDQIVGVARRMPSVALPKVTWRRADVGTDRLEAIMDGADAVIHLAWAIQPSRHVADLARTNVVGTQRVLDAVITTGVPTLVHASSVGTYAPGPEVRPVDESWPTTGIATSLYSRHKAATERLLVRAAVAHPELRLVRLRTALVFKAGAAAEIARLFLGPLVPVSLIGRHGLPLSPAFDGLRLQVVHGDDVARAYVAALRAPRSGAWNIAADPVLDATALARALGARTVPVPPAAIRAAAALTWRARLQPTDPGWVDLALGVPTMDVTAARTDLGWTPAWSAPDTLADLLTGFARRAGMPTPPLEPRPGGTVVPLPHQARPDAGPVPATGTAPPDAEIRPDRSTDQPTPTRP